METSYPEQLGLPLGRQHAPPAKPFLKWAGGKRALLPVILPLVPPAFRTYHEPFLGGGAVFWELANHKRQGKIVFEHAVLSDVNPELVNVYRVVRDSLDALLPLLAEHRQRHTKEHYYATRALNPIVLSPVERAARFIYLNKTCYNGLYRVNRSGQFNVPMGSYKNPKIFSTLNLQAVSAALQIADIRCEDFSRVVQHAQSGDFVYFDLPTFRSPKRPVSHPTPARNSDAASTKNWRKFSALWTGAAAN